MPHHSMQSSAILSCSSPHSTTSLSSVARSHARTIDHGIKCGIKHVKNHANAIAPPLKWAKHALSVVSSPVISDTEDPARDQSSIQTIKLPEVIEVGSDGEDPVNLEKELGLCSPYSVLAISLI